MSGVFADTSFYLAILREDDPLHSLAMAASRENRRIITTEFILVELGNACARAADHADYLSLVRAMQATERVVIVPFSPQLFDRGLRLMGERHDKDWSLTDCTSFVVMTELGLHEALTADRHFDQAGFNALLK